MRPLPDPHNLLQLEDHPMTVTRTAAHTLTEAAREIGYDEQRGNRTKFAAEAGHGNGVAWCATFVSAILIRCGVIAKGAKMLSPSSRTMYSEAKKKGWAVPFELLVPGDVIHTWRGVSIGAWLGHVGFVEQVLRDGNGKVTGIISIEGNALPLDTPVLTPDGFRPIGELTVGDALVDPMGEESKVVAVYDHKARTTYRVSFSDCRTIEADGEHLWPIELDAHRTPKVASTLEVAEWLETGRKVGIQRPTGPFEFGKTSDGLDWVAGYLIGNGCASSGHVTTNALDESDVEVRFADAGYPLSTWRNTQGGAVNRGAAPDLWRRLGIVGRSWEKSIPAERLQGNAAARAELLAGLLDSDGTVDTFGRISFSSSSRELAEQVLWLVRSLGGTAGWYENDPKWTSPAQPVKQQGRRQHRVANIRFAYGFQPFTFARKGDRIKPRSMTRGYSITSIEECRTTDTRCITVSASSALYVAGDFIITHNTNGAGSATGGSVLRKTRLRAFWRLGGWHPPYAATPPPSRVLWRLTDGRIVQPVGVGVPTPVRWLPTIQAVQTKLSEGWRQIDAPAGTTVKVVA